MKEVPMKNDFLIRMEEQEDCLIWKGSPEAETGLFYRMFHKPVTGKQKNEMDCMHFNDWSKKPTERADMSTERVKHEGIVTIKESVGYHEHDRGTETFMVSQGSFFCYCMGRGFTMKPGDLLHIQPWMGHSFTPLEPKSRLNILFMGIDQQEAITQPELRIQEKFPGVYAEPAFNKMYREFNGETNERNVPAPNEVTAEMVQQFRPDGFGLREHEFPGVKLQLKIAKYETEGVKEVWDLFLKPGFYCEWDAFLPEYRFFWVREGRIRCAVKTSATETVEFEAAKDCLVSVPPYNPFRFEVLEDTRMYDLDCPSRLQDFCEELVSLRHTDSAKLNDKAALLALGKEFAFHATDFGYRG
jgi:mannose-6-phosphate isomerase-like protein (cupin superfamily)